MKVEFKRQQLGLLAAIFAVALAFGVTAFSRDKGSARTQYTFRYIGPDNEKLSVEQESNWVYDASAPECDGVDEQACTIQVDPAFVNAGSTPTLKSVLNIQAIYQPLIHSAYVSGSNDETLIVVNRTAE